MFRPYHFCRLLSESGRQSAGKGIRPYRWTGYAFASMSLAGVALTTIDSPIQREKPVDSFGVSQASTLQLLRSYLVWSVLGLPSLVDSSNSILDFLLHSRIPLVPTITEAVVRATFFAQFIPGETALECLPAMEALRRNNIGSALNYSAEADVDVNADELDVESRRFREIERALDVQGEFEQRMQAEGWAPGSSAFAVKVSGLIDHDVMERASSVLNQRHASNTARIGAQVPNPGFPSEDDIQIIAPITAGEKRANETGLTSEDLRQLQLLWHRLDSIAERARRNGMKYNRPAPSASTEKGTVSWKGPVIYGTYQSYLMRQPKFLQAAIQHAEANGYALGLKVVRGGYIVKERAVAEKAGKPGNGAVWANKTLTDASYNGTVETVLETLKSQLARETASPLAVVFGTHNADSVKIIIETLEAKGLASRTSNGTLRLRKNVEGRVNVAQLYDLSDIIRASFEPSRSAMSMCFIAYGTLREVGSHQRDTLIHQTMPFLSRRAIENKSIMSGPSGAAAERRRVGSALRQRFSLGW
ncbi:hypothetical protein IAR55_006068 [Kwoniella newhampshirensis]|uniref:Proline dehydrogenase n=1 Tax=Kwoniella newhampshirensis TaxID=1651941 RepID=A0AAW0YF68_9TREE